MSLTLWVFEKLRTEFDYLFYTEITALCEFHQTRCILRIRLVQWYENNDFGRNSAHVLDSHSQNLVLRQFLVVRMGGHQLAEFRKRAGNVVLSPPLPGVRNGARFPRVRHREPARAGRPTPGQLFLVAGRQIVRRQVALLVRPEQHHRPGGRRIVPGVAQNLLGLLRVFQHTRNVPLCVAYTWRGT